MEIERKIGPKGQIVIPEDMRRITGIRPRSLVFVTLEEGKIIIKPEKVKISSLLEEEVNKDGKILKKKINVDKFYEKEIKEKWKSS